MTDNKQETVRPETGIVQYLRNDAIVERFDHIIGGNPWPFITSVLTVVSTDPRGKLQTCTPHSVYQAAVSAATLALSVDPSTKQAWLVPRKVNGKMTAVFQIGYMGYYHMAMRTLKYRFINIAKLYEGITWDEDIITGAVTIGGNKTSDKHYAWIASFELVSGFRKTIVMTVDEIHAHARKYSPSYNFKDGPWKQHTEDMERKTILTKLISKWGYLDPHDLAVVESIEHVNADTDEAQEDFLELVPEVEKEVEVKAPASEAEVVDALMGTQTAPKTLEDRLRNDAKVMNAREATPGQRKALVNNLEIITNKNRAVFGKYLFNKPSAHEWTNGEVLAVWKYLAVTKDEETGEFIPNSASVTNLKALHARAMEADGNITLPGME